MQLKLLESAAEFFNSDEVDRAELIEAVEALSNNHDSRLSETILETLVSLGALNDSEREHQAVVRQEIQHCLAQPTESDSQAEAWGIYSAQFDHPYSGAYYEVVSNLTEHDRKTLLEMAAKGATEFWLWLSPLLIELAAFGDPNVGESIARWTALPPEDNRIMPKVDVFVVAHIALARLRCPLPDCPSAAKTISAEALAACGI